MKKLLLNIIAISFYVLPLSISGHVYVGSPSFDDHPFFSKNELIATRPFLLPLDSPLKSIVDSLFTQRNTLNQDSFQTAGFEILHKQPRSFIVVASHPAVPHYLFKVYFDDELRMKSNKESWRWLILRCQGAKKVSSVIKKYNLQHFVVPHKWIYPLPVGNAPLHEPIYHPKHTLLIVERMNLIPKEDNLYAWTQTITTAHLDELYLILTHGASIRSRPDNMHFTSDGRIALVDTEYPDKKPDYKSIRPYLSEEMRAYWDELTRIP